ncbi:MAG: 2OG-Fe(II) oxygenase [Bacteriovoracaceae bacterium]
MNTLNENLRSMNSCLELGSWYAQENFISDQICQNIYKEYSKREQAKMFNEAAIGRNSTKVRDWAIRKSNICWIEESDDFEGLKEFNLLLQQMMISLNQYFFLSLKHFESQVAYYTKNDFYKTHLDQFNNSSRRQVTCILYLNDCPVGGELIIYKKGTKDVVDKIVNPKRGTLVTFFSGHIYHEVRPVETPRFSLTTWFRDD